MFTIDITLKGMGIALSVQRKEETAAQALYEQILQALKQGGSEIVELTCDRQPEKRLPSSAVKFLPCKFPISPGPPPPVLPDSGAN